MQNYTIFNKNNKVFIAKTSPSDEKISENQIIHCNSEILKSYNFTSLFEDTQKKDFLILSEQEDLDAVFEKVTSHLYHVKAAGGIVRNERGDYLFMYRNGFWDLPKGHHEQGETIQQTAVREVKEECGMQNIEQRNFLGCSFHTYIMNGRKEIKQTFWYNMFCLSSEPLIPQKEEGIQKLCWVSSVDLQKVLDSSYANIRYLFKILNLYH